MFREEVTSDFRNSVLDTTAMIADNVLLEELKILPRLSRAQLAKELLESLDEPEDVNFIDLLWGEEVERRLAKIQNGTTKTIPGQEVLTEARRIVKTHDV